MEYLPKEILVEIFSFLKPNKNIFLVCKRFEEAMKTNMLWKLYIDRDFRCSNYEIKKYKESFISLYKYRSDLKILTAWFEKCDYDFFAMERLVVKRMPCDNSKIFKIPREIYLLSPTLTVASFINCNIEEFPKELFQLENLRELILSNNMIKKIPKEIENLKNLEIFNISINKISKLPIGLCRLVYLKKIYLFGNPLYESKKRKDIEFLNKLANLNIEII